MAMHLDTIVPDTLRGLFTTREQLDEYEKMWHMCVYQPTWDEQSRKVKDSVMWLSMATFT